MSFFSSLTRQQKEAVGLLQVGTVLEYFDLMLYIHMAVVLNEVFFPSTDPFTASLVAAFSFCTSFVFRPFGALLFGYIGDNFGRKTTVIITTGLMALSCVGMAILPTYAKIGITAAWLLTLCRAVQGISSVGEIIGSEIYLAEITKPPARYPIVSFILIAASLGELLALGVAWFITAFGWDWRYAFWFGASIAVFGSVARTRLRETPDFLEAKQRKKKSMAQSEKVNKKTAFALFVVFLVWPIYFYFAYVHCGGLLKDKFGFSVEQIIQQSFQLSFVELAACCLTAYLSYYVYPLKIIKFKICVCFFFIFLCPFLLTHVQTPFQLFLIQVMAVVFGSSHDPAGAIFYAHFPVLKKFTSTGLIYAVARGLMNIISSFGLVYLTVWMGNWGLWVIMIPGAVAFTWGILYFEKLDKPEREAWQSIEERGPFQEIESPILKEAA